MNMTFLYVTEAQHSKTIPKWANAEDLGEEASQGFANAEQDDDRLSARLLRKEIHLAK